MTHCNAVFEGNNGPEVEIHFPPRCNTNLGTKKRFTPSAILNSHYSTSQNHEEVTMRPENNGQIGGKSGVEEPEVPTFPTRGV